MDIDLLTIWRRQFVKVASILLVPILLVLMYEIGYERGVSTTSDRLIQQVKQGFQDIAKLCR